MGEGGKRDGWLGLDELDGGTMGGFKVLENIFRVALSLLEVMILRVVMACLTV